MLALASLFLLHMHYFKTTSETLHLRTCLHFWLRPFVILLDLCRIFFSLHHTPGNEFLPGAMKYKTCTCVDVFVANIAFLASCHRFQTSIQSCTQSSISEIISKLFPTIYIFVSNISQWNNCSQFRYIFFWNVFRMNPITIAFNKFFLLWSSPSFLIG